MNPCPSSPSSADAGRRQSWKTTSLVSLARIPSLSSFLPADMPGVPCSSTNAEMPRCPFARSVTAITTMTPPILPWVMKFLDPFSTQPSPERIAVVRIAAASLPALASVSPQAPRTSPVTSRGRYSFFCASLANIARCARAEPVVRRDRQRNGGTHARELFDADAVVDARHRRIRRTPRRTGSPSARAPRASAAGPSGTPAPRPIHHVRAHLGFGKFTNRAPQDVLVLAQPKIHRREFIMRPPWKLGVGSWK